MKLSGLLKLLKKHSFVHVIYKISDLFHQRRERSSFLAVAKQLVGRIIQIMYVRTLTHYWDCLGRPFICKLLVRIEINELNIIELKFFLTEKQPFYIPGKSIA